MITSGAHTIVGPGIRGASGIRGSGGVIGVNLWTPLNQTGLAEFFDSRTLNAGAVASFASSDTTAQTMVQATGANQPIKGSTGLVFDGSNDVLARSTFPTTFMAGATLPDGASNSTAGKGFTCTGMTRAADGTWWIANHGKAQSGDPTFAASLVHVSANFLTLLGEILLVPMGVLGSVQGVVYDKSDGTLWFADLAALKIRHITTAGVPVGDEITLTYVPNGLARDNTDDALWIVAEETDVSNTIEKRSCATGASLSTATVTQPNRDQLFYDDTNRVLLMSYGANGTAGNIQIWGAATNTLASIGFFPLTINADAVEGIYWDGINALYVANDGYFHAGTPALNRILTYKVPPLVSNTIDFLAVFSVAVLTGTDALFEMGDPLTAGQHGWGLYSAAALTDLRIIAQTGTGTQITAIGVTPSLASMRIIYGRIDTVNDVATLWVDGTQVGTVSAALLSTALTNFATFRLGAAASAGRNINGTEQLLVVYANAAGADRLKSEGYAAWQYGLVANLPGGHPYKNNPPTN